MSREVARMGFRNAFRRRRVAMFTIVSIAISVSLLYTALSASTSLQNSANLFLQDTLSPIDLTVSNGGQWNNRISPEMRAGIERIAGVTNAIPRIEEYVWVENGTENLYLILVGLDLLQETHVGSLNATHGVVSFVDDYCFLTSEAKELLDLSVGDEFELRTSAGLHYLNVSGYGLALDKGIIGPVIFVSLEKAHDIYHIRYPDESVGKLLIEVDDVFQTPRIMTEITLRYEGQFVVSNLKQYPLELANIFLTQARTILLALVAAACFIAIFRVFSAFAMVFNERRYETGVVLAFGASRSKVLTLLMSEIFTIGALGAIIGGVLGLVVGAIVIHFVTIVLSIMAIAPTSSFIQSVNILDSLGLVIAGVLGIILTLFAGYIPAWRASQESVIESLGSGPIASSQRSAISPGARRRIHHVLGGAALALASLVSFQMVSDLWDLHLVSSDFLRIASIPAFLLVVIALSPYLSGSSRIIGSLVARSTQVVQLMAQKNVRRNTMSGLIVFNLFVSVTVLFFASSNVGLAVTGSWSANIGWQTSSANVVVYMDPLAEPEFIDEVSRMANVTEAVAMNQGLGNMVSSDNTEFGLIMGIQPDGFARLASLALLSQENETLGFFALDEPLTCIVSEHAADLLNIGVGDTIEVGAAAEVRVVGICGSAVPIFVVSVVNPIFAIIGSETWEYARGEPFAIGSILVDSSDPQTTLAEIIDVPGAHPVMVSSLEADYEAALNAIQVVVNASLVTLFLVTMASAFLSSWSIASTRRREIGMLSALGMTKSEIARTLTAESATGMISGVGVGVVAGLLVQIALSEIVLRFTSGTFNLVEPVIVILIILSLMGSIAASYYAIGSTTNTRVVILLRDLGRGR